MAGYARKCTEHPFKSCGHASKWQDKVVNVPDMVEYAQDILGNLVDMLLNGRMCS